MITFQQAQKLALKEKEDQYITNTAKYKDYYVFFMQPKRVDPSSEDALTDNYVVINSISGEIEYKSIFDFDDFFDKAVQVK